MRVGPCSRLHFACRIAISLLKVRSRRDLDPTLESTGRQLPARMSTARAFPPCVPSSPPSDIICDLWFAACASLSVCYIYDHARSAAIRAPCHRAPNIDTRCNRSFRQTLRPAVKIAKADIPRISTPSRVDLHQHPCAGAAAPMRRCCSTHATNPRRSKCRGQTRSSWMWATFQRTCHGQTFRLLSCSLFSSVCLRRSFVLTIMDLPGGVRCFLTSARTMPLLRRQSRGRGTSQTLACISRGARMHEQACKDKRMFLCFYSIFGRVPQYR